MVILIDHLNRNIMKIEEELKHEFGSRQQRAATNVIFTSNWILIKYLLI